jgi:hypothetical protein
MSDAYEVYVERAKDLFTQGSWNLLIAANPWPLFICAQAK